MAKVICCVFSWTIIAPLSRGVQGLREFWLSYQVPPSEELQLQSANPVRRLNHSLLQFNPRNRNINTNLLNENQNNLGFILPTLTELDILDRRRNAQIAESRFTEIV